MVIRHRLEIGPVLEQHLQTVLVTLDRRDLQRGEAEFICHLHISLKCAIENTRFQNGYKRTERFNPG